VRVDLVRTLRFDKFAGSEFGRTLVRPAGPEPGMVLAIPLSAHAQSVGLIHLCDETEDLVRTLRFDKTAG